LLNETRLTIFVMLAGLAAGCGAAPAASGKPFPGDRKANVTDRRPINQRFRNLDEYLAYLRKHEGPVDGPWYLEVRPGVYVLQTGNLRILGADGQEKKVFTREELERKFGFAK